MTVGYVLFWLGALLVGSGLVRELRARRPERRGWLGKYAFLAALGLAAELALGIDAAGHVLGIGIFVLLVGPGYGLARLEKLAVEGNWKRARRLAATLRLLHPFDGYWRLPRVFRALELDAKNDPRASDLFATVERDPRWSLRARIYRLRRREDWEGILALPEASPFTDTLAFSARLRALGECGRREELLARTERLVGPSAGPLQALRHPAMLYTFAFYGRGELVNRILLGPLRTMPPYLRDFWLVTAGLFAGGNAETVARAELAGPRFEPWREGVGALERRRHTGPVSPPSAAESERLDGLATMVAHENAALPELYAGGARKNPATTAVCLVLLAVYLVEEWLGGSENLEVAVAMGAIYSGPGVKPELWRLFAANFLHFGWLHLAMNVGAFFALGPFVERRLGAVRYLLVLLASGLGSMALTTYVFYAGREVVLVGASGAIMGLVGATAAVLLRLRDGDRSGLVGKRLRSIVFILALQFSFDLLTPRVSFAAHASGVLCGFAAALLIDATRREKRQ